jgi:hypothetical protein
MDNAETDTLTFWDRHRFLLLIVATVVIAIGLVSISMSIYNSSGAAQLDLSRPGYRDVIKVTPPVTPDFEAFSSSGPVNAATTSQFKTLYDKQAANATTVDAYGGDPLDPDVLNIGTTSTDTTTNQ